jgi:hypothetical protein
MFILLNNELFKLKVEQYPKLKPYKLLFYRALSGVGGIRTLVQTSNT